MTLRYPVWFTLGMDTTDTRKARYARQSGQCPECSEGVVWETWNGHTDIACRSCGWTGQAANAVDDAGRCPTHKEGSK